MRRVMCAVGTVRPFADGYSMTTGQYAASRSNFRDQLKQHSERMSVRTGITHDFVEVDRRDTQTLGVTDEGLESTRRHRRSVGLPDLPDPSSL